MVAPAPLVGLAAVSRAFDGGAIVALRQASLEVHPGERMSIVGASGSGKSTLLQMMSGIDRPSSGVVRWCGEPVEAPRRWAALRATEIGVVFQDFLLLPALTALQNVLCAISDRSTPASERRARAGALLGRVGLAGRADHRPSALSGGERQRVAIARSLVNGPRLLLADEPTGALDSDNAALIVDLLFALQHERGHAIVLVTHDAALAARCERRVAMRDGLIVSDSR